MHARWSNAYSHPHHPTPKPALTHTREGYRVHMERTGRSNGLMMGYFGNAEAPDAPFAFYYCDHLYSDSWNKTDGTGACVACVRAGSGRVKMG